MKIDLINNSTISKQLKLTRKDSVKVANLFRQYRLGKTKGIFNQLTDIFTPYLKEEAKIKTTQNKFLEKDFLQELYLKLFENFSKIGEKDHPVTSLVQKLSNINPSKNELVTMPKHITFDELTDTDHKKHSAEILFTSETPKGRVQRLLKTSQLSQREQNIMSEYMEGKNTEEIAQTYYLTKSRINQIFTSIIKDMKLIHNKKFRTEYFEKYSIARKLAEEKNLKFEQTTDTKKPDSFDKIKIIKHPKIETPQLKRIKIKPEETLVKSDIDSCNIIVYKKAKLKQDGIVTGNIENHGQYDLTGLSGANTENYGEFNLHGTAESRIKNFGKLNITGTAREEIINKGDAKLYGIAKGNIINSGNLEIYGRVEGNIYTYNDNINIAKGAKIIGKIYDLS